MFPVSDTPILPPPAWFLPAALSESLSRRAGWHLFQQDHLQQSWQQKFKRKSQIFSHTCAIPLRAVNDDDNAWARQKNAENGFLSLFCIFQSQQTREGREKKQGKKKKKSIFTLGTERAGCLLSQGLHSALYNGSLFCEIRADVS